AQSHHLSLRDALPIFIGNTAWGGPESLKPYYQTFLIFHIVLATVAAVFGITTLTLGFKEKYAKHRKWGKVTSIIWFFTAITGVRSEEHTSELQSRENL